MIVTTTLRELEAGAGHGVTAGGMLLPMRDVIRMASHAYHYLAVFDKHTKCSLYLGRTRRTASPAQRIMLYAKYGGCTRPGCTMPGWWCQVHHAVTDWADGGHTESIPPPHLDSGQARVNEYHHPEEMLVENDDDAAG